MKNLQSYARFLEIFCMIIIMPLTLLTFIFRWMPSEIARQAYESPTGVFYTLYLSPFSLETVSTLSRLFAAFFDGISFILFFAGCIYFIKLLRCYRRGELFSANTLLLFKKISRIVFVWTVYSPIKFTFINLILTFHRPVGQRELAIALSPNDIVNIFIVGFFLIMTSLMHEAYTLKHEQDLTV